MSSSSSRQQPASSVSLHLNLLFLLIDYLIRPIQTKGREPPKTQTSKFTPQIQLQTPFLNPFQITQDPEAIKPESTRMIKSSRKNSNTISNKSPLSKSLTLWRNSRTSKMKKPWKVSVTRTLVPMSHLSVFQPSLWMLIVNPSSFILDKGFFQMTRT